MYLGALAGLLHEERVIRLTWMRKAPSNNKGWTDNKLWDFVRLFTLTIWINLIIITWCGPRPFHFHPPCATHPRFYFRIPWFQNMVSEIFFGVGVLKICKLRCFISWPLLGETHLPLEPRRGKAWTVMFPMANSNTKFIKISTAGIRWANGLILPQNTDLWFQYYMDFVSFVQRWCYLPIFMYGWCRVTVCHAEMEIESWWPWFWPVGWYAASHRFTICRWHLAFYTIGLEVGKLLDSLVGGGSCVERWQNCYFDKSNSTAFNNHNWSWNHIEGSAMQCRAELVGLHVNCVRIGTKIFGLAIPSPASGKGVSCQQMDFGAPESSNFSASPLFWCCCFIGCVLCRWASYHLQGVSEWVKPVCPKAAHERHRWKELPVHKRTIASQMSIFRIHCKKW